MITNFHGNPHSSYSGAFVHGGRSYSGAYDEHLLIRYEVDLHSKSCDWQILEQEVQTCSDS